VFFPLPPVAFVVSPATVPLVEELKIPASAYKLDDDEPDLCVPLEEAPTRLLEFEELFPLVNFPFKELLNVAE